MYIYIIFSCLLLNVYLPCDNYSNTTVTQGFIDCVEYIEYLHKLSDCSSYICLAILIPALRGIMRSLTILQILLRGIVYVLLGTMPQL